VKTAGGCEITAEKYYTISSQTGLQRVLETGYQVLHGGVPPHFAIPFSKALSPLDGCHHARPTYIC